jgi:ubiquinone/menaquinone biosynthesis C-methylase UbiE
MDYDKEQREVTMIEQCADLHDRDVLEIGCGDGQVSTQLAPKARKYIAIDTDRQHIREAQSLPTTVDFRLGTGEALAFADVSFHVVVFTLSLHHQNCRLALNEAYRVLREQGQVVIVEPAADGEFQQFFHLFNDETEALMSAWQAIKQSDFTIERHETFSTIITFHTQDELCHYPFDRTTRHPDDCARILEMYQRLHGTFPTVYPMHLHDSLHIWALRKTCL